jgi:serine/threonine-protein kinase
LAEPNDPNGLLGQRYEREKVLGRGGQGVVYRAFDRWMKRPVAIKVMSSRFARQPQMAERLIRELQALSALKGTAAVEVLDIYRGDEGELCLVMELLTGKDLDDRLVTLEDRGERLSLREIVQIFAPVVDTLEVAHEAGILHRDLKPANVFLLDGGGVRLLDFGMARLRRAAPLTAIGTVMGSPSFMAPEAWKGQPELVDCRADVYSLGVMLFRALAGEMPFSGKSLQEKLLNTTTRERPSLVAKRPDFPADADEWVALALAIDREQRFQTARALWNAFLATFDLKSEKTLWDAARGAVKRIADLAIGPDSADAPASDTTPSFTREALAGSVLQLRDPDVAAQSLEEALKLGPRAAEEKTVELPAPPAAETPRPQRTPPPPPRPTGRPAVERTVELDSEELLAHEDTLREGERRGPT